MKKKRIKIFSISLLTALLLAVYTVKCKQHPNEIAFAQDTSVDWIQFQNNAQHHGRTSVGVAPGYKLTWAWIDENHVVRNFVSRDIREGNTVIGGTKITDIYNRQCDSHTDWPCNPNYPQGKIDTAEVILAEQMQPIVSEGKVFFGSVNGTMYAVDALTGNTVWKYQSKGAILAAAACHQGTLIFVSMDGKVYGLNAANGNLKWSYETGAGINAAPVLHNGAILVGSRDGYFYSINAGNGSLNWRYETRTTSTDPLFEKAPIASSPAVSEDGNTVMFGAENMYFYALNVANGTERWKKKLIGQSFLYSWPVVNGDKVIVRTMSSLKGAEKGSTGLENPGTSDGVLDRLSANPDWITEEKPALLNWLRNDPHQKTMYVFNVNNGNEPYQVAMGRVTGDNKSANPPVIDNQGRLLTYWRVKRASYTTVGEFSCFGTIYCPDIGAMDMNTGDRIKLSPLTGFNPELDNAFSMSVGGDYLYLHNHFRGLRAINLSTNRYDTITAPVAKWDWGDFRPGYDIVYYGNDEYPVQTRIDPKLPKAAKPPSGFASVTPARVSGRNILFVNESRAGVIAAIEHQ